MKTGIRIQNILKINLQGHVSMCLTVGEEWAWPTAESVMLVSPLKCSGVRQLHLKVFSAIQV